MHSVWNTPYGVLHRILRRNNVVVGGATIPCCCTPRARLKIWAYDVCMYISPLILKRGVPTACFAVLLSGRLHSCHPFLPPPQFYGAWFRRNGHGRGSQYAWTVPCIIHVGQFELVRQRMVKRSGPYGISKLHLGAGKDLFYSVSLAPLKYSLNFKCHRGGMDNHTPYCARLTNSAETSVYCFWFQD